jgi:hypothetical protein
MNRYSSLSDDHYLNMNLTTEMDLPTGRETLVHYFEQVQRKFPAMRNFYNRERSEFVIEEEKDRGHYRWASLEAKRLSAGHVNPSTIEEALVLHRTLLEIAPYALAASPLDCESLNVMLGFDYTYRGNHNQLVAEALGLSPAMERLLEIPGAGVVSYEPSVTLSFDDDFRVQVRVSIENRTTALHLRAREFPEEQISVYVTARHFGSLPVSETMASMVERLTHLCCGIVDDCVADHVLRPLQQAIAAR